VRRFIRHCEDVLASAETYAYTSLRAVDPITGRVDVETQVNATLSLMDMHKRLAELLPSPDNTATAHLSRGIALNLQGMEVAVTSPRGPQGTLNWRDRRRIDRLTSEGQAEMNRGFARLQVLAGSTQTAE
jgi:hypothetical protein